MKTIDKILKVLEIRGITPTAAERKIGVSQGTLSKAIERKGSVHVSTQEKFIRTFHVKQLWWENGEGDIFEKNLTEEGKVEEPEIKYNSDLVKTKNQVIQAQLDLIAELRERINELKGALEECRAQANKEKVQPQ